MKRNLLLFAVMAIAAVFTFSACKKDKPEVKKNEFTYNNRSYELKAGKLTNFFVLTNFTLLTADPNGGIPGSLSTVSFNIDYSPVTNGTFTFKPTSDADYDATKNFSSATALLDINALTQSPGKTFSQADLTSGTITIKKNGDNDYSVTFKLVFATNTIEGSYSGKFS